MSYKVKLHANQLRTACDLQNTNIYGNTWEPKQKIETLSSVRKLTIFGRPFCWPTQGVTRGARGSQFPERRVTMVAPNQCGGALKSQQCHKHFLQYSKFASEKPQFRTWGAKFASCPGRHPTSLRPWTHCHLGVHFYFWCTLRTRTVVLNLFSATPPLSNCPLFQDPWQ